MPEKRIALRFEESEFQALDDKRHALRTSFQAVGYRLFMDWLQGERQVQKESTQADPEPHSGILARVAKILDEPEDDVDHASIVAIVEAYSIRRRLGVRTATPATQVPVENIYNNDADKA